MDPRHLPNLRLPRTDRPSTWSVLGSVCLHLLALGLIVWVQARVPAESTTRRPGLPGDPGGGGGIHFISLDLPAPAPQVATATPPPPAPDPIVVPPPEAVTLPVRPAETPLPEVVATLGGTDAGTGAGAGSGGGAGGGVGGGLGRDSGVGAGGEGGDIFPPRPKYTILPPLPQPGSVRGKTFRVHFWVNAEGRVTRVKVEPEIKDAAYRQQFLDLMREYGFEPARRQDGTRVAGEIDYTITL